MARGAREEESGSCDKLGQTAESAASRGPRCPAGPLPATHGCLLGMPPRTWYAGSLASHARARPPQSQLVLSEMLTGVFDSRRLAAMLYTARDAALFAGVFFIAAAAALGGAAVPTADVAVRKVLATVGALLLCVPTLVLRPLIARLECAPWPRKEWRRPTPAASLAARAR